MVPNIGPIVRGESPAVLLLLPPTVLQRPLPAPKDGIDLARNMDELGHVMFDELESWIPEEMLDVSNISREQIIHHHDFAISAEE